MFRTKINFETPDRTGGTPLKILFALPGLHQVARGAEVAFEEVARRIATRPGFEVTLIGSGPRRRDEPYRYVQSPCIARERFEKFPSIPYLRDHYAYEELSFAPGLIRAFSPAQFDITVTCAYPYTNWALRSRRRNGWPRHVFVTQNSDWMIRLRNSEYKHFGCDGLICINPEYYQRHHDHWPSVLIPNGVDPKIFRPGLADRQKFGLPADKPVVLMASALSSHKRVLEGIRAVPLLEDAYLVVAGEGEQRADVLALGNRLLPDRFRLVSLQHADMPGLYRSANVFLHMSQEEPFGIVYIEALASGLPIVAHDRDLTRWILEDQAVLVDTSDQRAVADGLVRAMNQCGEGDIRARHETAQRRFSWESISEQYCLFFEKIAGVKSTSSEESAA
jgi:glycosyltransferase involved in cell wall biosynthesis